MATESKQSLILKQKYPNRIPVIVQDDGSVNLEKKKYLVPNDFSMRQFLAVLRRHIKLNSSEALYIFVKDKTVCMDNLVSQYYDSEFDNDGFFKVKIAKENTFGF